MPDNLFHALTLGRDRSDTATLQWGAISNMENGRYRIKIAQLAFYVHLHR